jgi:hypothetical protein
MNPLTPATASHWSLPPWNKPETQTCEPTKLKKMNQDNDILPIGELPEEQREAFRLIEASLQTGDHPTARTHMGQLLEYYVGIDRKIPLEIEVTYARLLVLENP